MVSKRCSREVTDDGYEQTWRRLLDGQQIRGIAARLDGKVASYQGFIAYSRRLNAHQS